MEDNYKETFETWNKVAQLYQDKFMHLDLYNKSYDFVCDYLKPDAHIFEIGCGPGNITRYLLSRQPGYQVWGIDVAPNMVRLARQNNPGARFEVMDCREIGSLKLKFDAVICGFCLPYLSGSECEKLLKDSADMLNDHGLLYLSFVEGDPDKSGFQVGSSGDRVYFHYYKLEYLKKILNKNNFEELKVFEFSYGKDEKHVVLLAKKTDIK